MAIFTDIKFEDSNVFIYVFFNAWLVFVCSVAIQVIQLLFLAAH